MYDRTQRRFADAVRRAAQHAVASVVAVDTAAAVAVADAAMCATCTQYNSDQVGYNQNELTQVTSDLIWSTRVFTLWALTDS